jgi:hypothetical protein
VDPVTIGALVYAGQKVGSTVAGWIVPNKSPWQRYQEKIEWIAKSEAPGAMSNEEIRGIVHTAPTIGADLSTMNSAQDSASQQRTSLRDNRALVEGVAEQVHSVNADLRLMDAKKRLSSTIDTLQGVSKQNELKTNWKKGLMGIAAEQSVDEWEEGSDKIKTIGGIIGGGVVGLHMGLAKLLAKPGAIVGGGVQGGADIAMGAAAATGGTAGLSLGTGATVGKGIGAATSLTGAGVSTSSLVKSLAGKAYAMSEYAPDQEQIKKWFNSVEAANNQAQPAASTIGAEASTTVDLSQVKIKGYVPLKRENLPDSLSPVVADSVDHWSKVYDLDPHALLANGVAESNATDVTNDLGYKGFGQIGSSEVQGTPGALDQWNQDHPDQKLKLADLDMDKNIMVTAYYHRWLADKKKDARGVLSYYGGWGAKNADPNAREAHFSKIKNQYLKFTGGT